MSALVSTDWLAERLSAPDIRVVDATWFMPDSGRNARAEFETAHIPGAVHFDIDEICDETSPYPHMVPSAAKFSAKVRKLGLGDGVTVVAYDANRFCASARVWWMFRLFGHEAVVVLDGGLERWRAEGRPLEEGPARPRERHLTARQNNTLLRELDQMRANVTSRREQVVNYEVDKTISVTRGATGTVRRLSAAVVINHLPNPDAKKGPATAALPPERLEQIQALVREAIGYNGERGDSVNVVNAPFNQPKVEPVEVPWYQNPDTQDLLRSLAPQLGLLALGLLLFLGMVRPALKMMRPEPAPAEAGAASGGALPAPGGQL
ncbi:MAG: hypothetical protein K6T74_10355, partial [Geminicoccaceae bacterium]|nr:hypothetical protein [Geminicoccaceae bacterium]